MHIQPRNIQYAKKAINIEFERTWIQLANSYIALELYEKAIYAYEEALRCNPYNSDALYNMCQMAIAINDTKKAISLIARISKLKEQETRYHILCGHYFLRLDINKSYHHFILALEGSNADEYLLYGVAQFKEMIGNYEGARNIFLKYYNKLSFYSHCTVVLFRLSVIYKMLGNFDIAIRLLNILKQMKRLNRITINDLNFQIAHIHFMQGKVGEAEFMIEDILSNDKKHVFGQRMNAWLKYKRNEDFDKKDYFVDAYCYYIEARHLIDNKNVQDAISLLNSAKEMESGDPWIWNSLGIAYYKNKEYEKAKEQFLGAHLLDKTSIIYEKNLTSTYAKLDSTCQETTEDVCDVTDVVPDPLASCYFDTHLLFDGKIYVRNDMKVKMYNFKPAK